MNFKQSDISKSNHCFFYPFLILTVLYFFNCVKSFSDSIGPQMRHDRMSALIKSTDLSIPNDGYPMYVFRQYTSHAADRNEGHGYGALGVGWSLNAHYLTLKIADYYVEGEPERRLYTVELSDGKLLFESNAESQEDIKSLMRLSPYKLEYFSGESEGYIPEPHYVLSCLNCNLFIFPSSGAEPGNYNGIDDINSGRKVPLQYVITADGHSVRFFFNSQTNQVNRIEDEDGRAIEFDYDDETHSFLKRIVYDSGPSRVVEFEDGANVSVGIVDEVFYDYENDSKEDSTQYLTQVTFKRKLEGAMSGEASVRYAQQKVCYEWDHDNYDDSQIVAVNEYAVNEYTAKDNSKAPSNVLILRTELDYYSNGTLKTITSYPDFTNDPDTSYTTNYSSYTNQDKSGAIAVLDNDGMGAIVEFDEFWSETALKVLTEPLPAVLQNTPLPQPTNPIITSKLYNASYKNRGLVEGVSYPKRDQTFSSPHIYGADSETDQISIYNPTPTPNSLPTGDDRLPQSILMLEDESPIYQTTLSYVDGTNLIEKISQPAFGTDLDQEFEYNTQTRQMTSSEYEGVRYEYDYHNAQAGLTPTPNAGYLKEIRRGQVGSTPTPILFLRYDEDNPAGLVNEVEDASGNVARQVYAPVGRLLESRGPNVNPTPSAQPTYRTVRYEYDGVGRVVEIQGPVVIDGENEKRFSTQIQYDDEDKWWSVIDPAGTRFMFAYDGFGRPTYEGYKLTTGSLGQWHVFSSYEYDDVNPALVKRVNLGLGDLNMHETDPVPEAYIEIEYDDLDMPSAVHEYVSGTGTPTPVRSFYYEYDDSGQLRKLDDTDHGSYAFNYERRGLLENVFHNDNSNDVELVQRFAYDGAGRLTDLTYPYAGQTPVPSQSTSMTVQFEGGLPISVGLHCGADILGVNPSPTPTPDYQIEFAYNNLNRVTNVDFNGSGLTETRQNLSYDLLDRVKTIDYQRYVSSYFESMLKFDISGSNGWRDAEGQVREMTVLRESTQTRHMSYEYDVYGRLISEVCSHHRLGEQWRVDYSYDDAGHRLSRHLDYADGNDKDVNTSWLYEKDSEETVRRTEIENQSGLDGYEYDVQGNLTYLPGWEKDCEGDEALDLSRQYEWDVAGNLISAKDGNNNTLAEYDYDHLGRRIKKRYIENGSAVKEVLYGYIGSGLSIAREWERFNDGEWSEWRIRREYMINGGGAGQIAGVRLFIYSDNADTEADEILLFRYVYDLSLNVAAVLDEEGEIVYVDPEGRTSSESGFVSSAAAVMCLFEYDAFGNNLYRATSNRPNSETAMRIAWNEIFPHHLAGKEWDPEARLYYFGSRWYEPQQGAFISRSPIGPLAEETYAYCSNDPVNFVDVDGLSAEEVIEEFKWIGVTLIYFVDEVNKNWVDNLAAAGEGAINSFSAGCLAVTWTDQSRADLQLSQDIGYWTAEIFENLRTSGGKLLLKKGAKAGLMDGAARAGLRQADNIGWKLGDPITNLTKKKTTPSWTAIRQRFWKNEALYNPISYDADNLKRMRKGLAPQQWNLEKGKWESMHLHHTGHPPRSPKNIFDFEALWPEEHYALHYGR